jgi:hypothetical protein
MGSALHLRNAADDFERAQHFPWEMLLMVSMGPMLLIGDTADSCEWAQQHS